jgi:hypothetical protein
MRLGAYVIKKGRYLGIVLPAVCQQKFSRRLDQVTSVARYSSARAPAFVCTRTLPSRAWHAIKPKLALSR